MSQSLVLLGFSLSPGDIQTQCVCVCVFVLCVCVCVWVCVCMGTCMESHPTWSRFTHRGRNLSEITTLKGMLNILANTSSHPHAIMPYCKDMTCTQWSQQSILQVSCNTTVFRCSVTPSNGVHRTHSTPELSSTILIPAQPNAWGHSLNGVCVCMCVCGGG